jgi:glycosyltransferase involved in cell wall biosynthesis
MEKKKKKIEDYINKNNLNDYIKLKGFKKNIFPYFSKAKGFILPSLWEDPGFVLIEAGYCRVPIFSSNCKPGPAELIKDNFNGTVFESNNLISFKTKFKEFLDNYKNNNLILNNLIGVKKFTIFNHYLSLMKILNS